MDPEMDTLANEDFAYLTTRGRRTGTLHTIEIWFGVHGGRAYMLSGGGGRSDWVRNLRVDPEVGLRIGSRVWKGAAQVVDEPEEGRRARALLASKYQGWRPGRPMSRWAETALPIRVDPVPP